MRVNFAFAGSFANPLVPGSRFAIVMLLILFTVSSFRKHPDRDLKAKQVNLIIRHIGHRLLLQAGDATSRVLPVREIKKGIFLLKFEKEFVFNHDSLMTLSLNSFPKTDFPSGYTVTINDCLNGDIVYGFQVNNTSPDLMACSGRSEPPGLYSIEFAFPDFYENSEQKKAGIKPLSLSAKVNLPGVDSKPGIKEAATAYDLTQRLEAHKGVKVAVPEANPKLEGFNTATSVAPRMNLVYAGVLALLGLALLVGRFGKNVKPVPAQSQNHANTKEAFSDGSALGQYVFDEKGRRLVFGTEVIPLTDKECKVLALLHKNFGELIPRETLMQEVWINEGVITGRSLDMFVSKLRKKLSSDPELRITNIHGKGYKLEILQS